MLIVMFSPVTAKKHLLKVPAKAVVTAIRKMSKHMKLTAALDSSGSGIAMDMRAVGMMAPNKGLMKAMIREKMTPKIEHSRGLLYSLT